MILDEAKAIVGGELENGGELKNGIYRQDAVREMIIAQASKPFEHNSKIYITRQH
jgi:hypothetical protein